MEKLRKKIKNEKLITYDDLPLLLQLDGVAKRMKNTLTLLLNMYNEEVLIKKSINKKDDQFKEFIERILTSQNLELNEENINMAVQISVANNVHRMGVLQDILNEFMKDKIEDEKPKEN